MVVELRFEIGVCQHLMDRFFHVARPFIQSDIDPLLDLNNGQAEHNPNEDESNGNFDNGA